MLSITVDRPTIVKELDVLDAVLMVELVEAAVGETSLAGSDPLDPTLAGVGSTTVSEKPAIEPKGELLDAVGSVNTFGTFLVEPTRVLLDESVAESWELDPLARVG